jgi:predicted membrane protein
MAWLPLCVALLVLVALTTHPGITADTAGRADTAAIWLMLWAMAAGFSRGHGFSPVTGSRAG